LTAVNSKINRGNFFITYYLLTVHKTFYLQIHRLLFLQSLHA